MTTRKFKIEKDGLQIEVYEEDHLTKYIFNKNGQWYDIIKLKNMNEFIKHGFTHHCDICGTDIKTNLNIKHINCPNGCEGLIKSKIESIENIGEEW